MSSSSSSCAVSPSLRSELFSSTSIRLAQSRSKCAINRRAFAFKGIVASGASVLGSSLVTEPVAGLERLPFKPEGYNYWTWRGHKIHYVVQGEGVPIVLIHGFGASAFHWRYNIPELAKKYKVYALDLLGFGWSEKALIEYDAVVWRDQVVDFLKEIVKEPATVVGNSQHIYHIMYLSNGDKCIEWKRKLGTEEGASIQKWGWRRIDDVIIILVKPWK